MKLKLSPHTWKLLAAAWLVFVSILLVIPGDALPQTGLAEIPFFDKLVHVILFGVLSFLALKAFAWEKRELSLGIFITVVGYGIAMEFVQKYLVPFRSFDLADIVADTLGAWLGWRVFSILAKKY